MTAIKMKLSLRIMTLQKPMKRILGLIVIETEDKRQSSRQSVRCPKAQATRNLVSLGGATRERVCVEFGWRQDLQQMILSSSSVLRGEDEGLCSCA